jgi:hypothetical protein
MRKSLDWKRSRISLFEGEAVPHSFIPYVQIGVSIALYMRSLLLAVWFDYLPSSQCTLVSVIPSCFRFVNMCSRQVRI